MLTRNESGEAKKQKNLIDNIESLKYECSYELNNACGFYTLLKEFMCELKEFH